MLLQQVTLRVKKIFSLITNKFVLANMMSNFGSKKFNFLYLVPILKKLSKYGKNLKTMSFYATRLSSEDLFGAKIGQQTSYKHVINAFWARAEEPSNITPSSEFSSEPASWELALVTTPGPDTSSVALTKVQSWKNVT